MSRYQPRNIFRGGQPISAEALNENFAELEYAINDAGGGRPGNGVTRENISRRSIPPTALENPYIVHAWGTGLRTDTFTVGATNYYGIDDAKTFHIATPDHDVRLIRIAGWLGAGADVPDIADVQLFIDDEDTGFGLTLDVNEPTHVDLSIEVTSGSKIEAKFVNTHNGKFYSGGIWLYARSLPWI